MKTFYNILFNSLFVSIANNTVWFAVTFWIYLETRSVVATSLIGGIYLVISTLSGFWLGSLVDHHRKKNVILAGTTLSLICYILALLLFLNTPDESFRVLTNPVLWTFITLLLFGVIPGNIRSIAIPTLVGILVDEKSRDKANGFSGMIFGVSFLFTSVISGFLLAYGGMFWVLASVIAVTVLSIIHLLLIPVGEEKIVSSDDHPKKVDIKGTLKVIRKIPGLLPLLFFTMFNNFLGGVYMSLMDAYGLSLVSVQTWGTVWGVISIGFIIGGTLISKFGLGKNPVRTMFLVNMASWTLSMLFAVQPWILLLLICMLISMSLMPFIEASEQTIIQKVVPQERQGRVFGFAQSVEWSAMPITAFLIGPIAQYIFIPFMTTGKGVDLIGGWFGVGEGRGLALVFIIAGVIGLIVTLLAFRSKSYKLLFNRYEEV
ncbi:MAG: MFS transporter [Candidatus Gracilibacteria bacterium]